MLCFQLALLAVKKSDLPAFECDRQITFQDFSNSPQFQIYGLFFRWTCEITTIVEPFVEHSGMSGLKPLGVRK